MPEVIFSVDQPKSLFEQGHNRWHPDIPPVAEVRPGREFRLECREWFDGIFARDNGGGFLTDRFPEGYKAVWDGLGLPRPGGHLAAFARRPVQRRAAHRDHPAIPG